MLEDNLLRDSGRFAIASRQGGDFLVESLGARIVVGTATAAVASIVGLYASYQFDLPSGAAIVVALGAALVLVGLGSRLRRTA